jgi:uncharacterized protein
MEKNMEKLKAKVLKNFECLECGNCCRLETGYTYCRPEEAEQIAAFLKMDIYTFISKHTIKENGWLILSSPKFATSCFLDKNNRCQIYDVRPENCRTYPDWVSVWKSDDLFRAETKTCPGLKKTLEKITT